MRCGPYAVHEIQCRRTTGYDLEVLDTLTANGIDCGWYSFPPHPMYGSKENASTRKKDYFKDKFYHVQLDMRADDLFPGGEYEFRMRCIDPFDLSAVGPWSDTSAAISVGQAEA